MAPQRPDQGIPNTTSSFVLAGKIRDKAFFLSYAAIDKGTLEDITTGIRQVIGFV